MPKQAIVLPVKTVSIGGFEVQIFEIDLDDSDAICGQIVTPGMGTITRRWNAAGICRDASPECNLDTRSPEVSAIVNLIRRHFALTADPQSEGAYRRGYHQAVCATVQALQSGQVTEQDLLDWVEGAGMVWRKEQRLDQLLPPPPFSSDSVGAG